MHVYCYEDRCPGRLWLYYALAEIFLAALTVLVMKCVTLCLCGSFISLLYLSLTDTQWSPPPPRPPLLLLNNPVCILWLMDKIVNLVLTYPYIDVTVTLIFSPRKVFFFKFKS